MDLKQGVMVLLLSFFILFSVGYLMDHSPKTGEYELTNESFQADVGNYVDLSQTDIVENSTVVYNDSDNTFSDYEVDYEEGAIRVGSNFSDNETYYIDYDFKDHTSQEMKFINAIQFLVVPLGALAFLFFAVMVLGRGGGF